MAKDITELLVIVIIIVIIFIIIAACCRGLRRAYEDHIATEDLARRRQAFFLDQSRNRRTCPGPDGVTRAVRITTISRDGDTIAMGVYEIEVPNQNRNGVSTGEGRRAGSQHAVDTAPPPPFSTAYEVSTPTVTTLDIDEPPPTYEDYVKYNSTTDLQAVRPQPRDAK